MGRSARQRKLKSVDPFNPKRNQILAKQRHPEGKDLAVNEKKDTKHIPRKLREIMHGQKKLAEIEAKRKAKKQGKPSQGSGPKPTTAAPKPAPAEAPAAAVASTPTKDSAAAATTSKKQDPKFEGMRPGESFHTFNQRIRKEAHDMLIEESKKNSRKLEKRKEYRAKRKEKESKKRKRSDDSDDDLDESETSAARPVSRSPDSDDEKTAPAPKRGPQRTVTHFAQLKDEIKFGEQVNAPPKLARLPRGAMPPAKKAKTPTLAAAMLQTPINAAEKRAMDLIRERIRNQLSNKQPIAKLTMQPIQKGNS